MTALSGHEKRSSQRRFVIGRRGLLTSVLGGIVATTGAKDAWADDITISGAGSSFVDPVMQRWIELTPKGFGVKATYDPIGSSGGRSKLLASEVDFAMSDQPLPADRLEAGHLIQFPVAYGGVAIAFNIPGVPSGRLRLTGDLLGGIYSGRIKNWNDQAIAAINPDLEFPALDIRPLYEGSPFSGINGTAYNFLQYLLATNADWREKYGTTTPARWAVGAGVKSNAAMTEVLKAVPGSISYVSLGVMRNNRLPWAQLRNKAGRFVEPKSSSIQAAINEIDWVKTPEMVHNLLDMSGEQAWPIVLATYAMLPRTPKDKAAGEATLKFFRYLVVDGGDAAMQRNAAAMPKAAQTLALEQFDKMDH